MACPSVDLLCSRTLPLRMASSFRPRCFKPSTADEHTLRSFRLDALGRRVDFHSLRYTFITSLALAGVHPAKAQRLARNSDINLTMGVYTSLSVDDLREAVSLLPLP